jgi:ribosomal-protein-alanine N-acetyltransferase
MPKYIHQSLISIQKSLIILETDRLILKRLQTKDIIPLVDIWSDPEVTHYLGGPRDRAWLQSEFEKTSKDPFAERYDLWPAIEKETGQVIGHCGLLEKEVEGRTEIELGYIISSPVWGKGFATEIAGAIKRYAFTDLKIKRLIALIEPNNTASERVAVKVGMYFEKEITRSAGTLRKVYIIEAKNQPSVAQPAAACDPHSRILHIGSPRFPA